MNNASNNKSKKAKNISKTNSGKPSAPKKSKKTSSKSNLTATGTTASLSDAQKRASKGSLGRVERKGASQVATSGARPTASATASTCSSSTFTPESTLTMPSGISHSNLTLLTADEEIALATKILAAEALKGKRGKGFKAIIEEGERARTRFIECNLRLVQFVARRHIGRGVDFDDLVQEGTLGLMHAITKYDPKRGYRFSTYAMPWIQQYISRAIGNGSRTIRIPLYQVEALNKMRTVHAKILAETNSEPTIAELAKASGLKEDRVAELMIATQSMVYIDAPVGEDGSQREISAPAAMSSVDDPADILITKIRDERLEALIGTLREKEALVLRMRFGLTESEPMTVDQISQQLDISRESVRQIERDAMSKLRHPSRSTGLSSLTF